MKMKVYKSKRLGIIFADEHIVIKLNAFADIKILMLSVYKRGKGTKGQLITNFVGYSDSLEDIKNAPEDVKKLVDYYVDETI